MYQVTNLYLLSALAVIGGVLFGFDIASVSAILSSAQYKCYFNQAPFHDADGNCLGPTSGVQGGITAAMPAGSWLGALISGSLTDAVGRRRAIGIGCILWIIGSIITATSQNIGQLCAGRVINGLCVGIASAQVPVYITELAPPTKRGRLVGAQQWAITWGIMIMFYISYGTIQGLPSGTSGSEGAWRIPWGVQAVPGMFLLAALPFMPESPRWLGNKGRWEQCHQVLTAVHGKGNPEHPLVVRELAEIRELTEFEQHHAASWPEIFNKKNINRTHIGLFMQIWSQLTGMNVMMYYITYVFQMAGQTGSVLLLSSSIQYIINVVMTVPALLFMDRWGRRPTMLIGAALMASFMFINGGLVSSGVHHPGGFFGTREVTYTLSGSRATALIACTYLFVASYAPTWGPVSWVYPPELYPLRTRGKSVAFATSGNWAFNTALGAFVPPAFENTGFGTYFIFGAFCVMMFIHVYIMFPETSGKTLEQVREIFEDPKGIPNIGTPAWRTTNSFKEGRALERGEGGERRSSGVLVGGENKVHLERNDSSEGTSPERQTYETKVQDTRPEAPMAV